MKRIIYTKDEKVGSCLFVKDIPSETPHRYGEFICPLCNTKFTARISHVKANKIKSCGCLNEREFHGQSATKLYEVWEAMKQRCLNPKNPSFSNYGKRGITICKEWLHFPTFMTWALGNGYTESLTLDRINNNKSYYPENCRFTTRSVQSANSRSGRQPKSGYTGVEPANKKFRARIKVDGKVTTIGTYPTSLEAAYARDLYIIENDLPHLRNFTDKEVESHYGDSNVPPISNT